MAEVIAQQADRTVINTVSWIQEYGFKWEKAIMIISQ